MDLARYGQTFKNKAVARLLPPESAGLELVARETGVGVGTIERWQAEMVSGSTRKQAQSAPARLDAVIATAAMNETAKNAWCREHGVYAGDLAQWVASAMSALAGPTKTAVIPKPKAQDGRRIKELERDLLRKDRALAETLALLVLSKKVGAIFNRGEDE
jgi:hypothetical protein